jgi:hypothetical protein
METCLEITDQLMRHHFSFLFLTAPTPASHPAYSHVIKFPMDLNTVHGKLRDGSYHNSKEWETDLKSVFDNCITFFGKTSAEGAIACFMKTRLQKLRRRLLLLKYDTWVTYSTALFQKFDQQIRKCPVKLKSFESLPESNLLTQPEYDKLAEALSAVRKRDDIIDIVRVLRSYGANVSGQKKNLAVTLHHLAPPAVKTLQRLVGGH